jgi:thiol-disulfide isomerase/thioredoxin
MNAEYCFGLIVVLIVLIFVLYKFSYKKQQKYVGQDKNATLVTMIHADWCGFCQKTKPVFDELKNKYHGTTASDGTVVKFEDYEESKDSEKVKEFSVDGYPTFFVTKVHDGVQEKPTSFNAGTDTLESEIKKYI